MSVGRTHIRQIIKEKKLNKLQTASQMRLGYRAFMYKLNYNTFSFEELIRLGNLIGVDLSYVEKETGKVAYTLDASIKHEPGKAKKINAEKFTERLVVKLKEQEISGSELARRSGVSKQSISSYLLGERKPAWENLRALAKALKVSPEWLAGEE